MNKRFTLCLALLTAACASFAQCSETPEPKVLLVGDSWAFFMTVDQTFNHVLKKWGHSDCEFYSNITLAENGAETDDFLTQQKQDEIALQLNSKPSIEVVHLSIGGNDVLGDWNVNFTQQQTDSLKLSVQNRLLQVIDFIKSVRPGIRIVWSGYVYPNFEEVIESAAPFQTSHPFYGTWQGMGFPSFLQINDLLNHFSEEVATYANQDPQLEFFDATGLMQYTHGQNTPLGVAPGGTYPPYSVPMPEGNPVYPSPKNSMRDYGITKDCFHLSAEGYFDLIEFQTRRFYHKYLMHDFYAVSLSNAQMGTVSSTGNVSGGLYVGEESGESFSTLLTFSTAGMADTSVRKASLFLRRESLAGNNPIDGTLEVRIAQGGFGASAGLEPSDYSAPGNASGIPCRFGSNGGDGHWIRLELPESFLPYISAGSTVQLMVSAPGATGGKVTFSGGDPELAPVLDITYGPNSAGVNEAQVSAFSVYPNPSNGILNISGKKNITAVEVTDAWGKTVLHKEGVPGTLDISSLPAGVYILNIITPTTTDKQRIIKL